MTDWPEDVVEQAARAVRAGLYSSDAGPWESLLESSKAMWRAEVAIALSALPPAAQAVLKGEAVAVPREATDEMIDASRECASSYLEDMWPAVIAASPYAKENSQ